MQNGSPPTRRLGPFLDGWVCGIWSPQQIREANGCRFIAELQSLPLRLRISMASEREAEDRPAKIKCVFKEGKRLFTDIPTLTIPGEDGGRHTES
jgi:hypothetical protein